MRKFLCELSEFESVKRMVVVGDLHGDHTTLLKILKVVDLEEDCLIFLGDYGDRGNEGIEVIDTLISIMEKYPSNVIALKGNHEDYTEYGKPKFSPCTLIEEAEMKMGSWEKYFFETFRPFVEKLYIAALVPGEFLFVHGGISSKITSIDDLKKPLPQLEIDILWSDPYEGFGEYPNPRGAGVLFGKDVSKKICEKLNVKRIVRSHEPRKAFEGPYYEHDGRVITISSTSVYGGKPFILLLNPRKPSEISHMFL